MEAALSITGMVYMTCLSCIFFFGSDAFDKAEKGVNQKYDNDYFIRGNKRLEDEQVKRQKEIKELKLKKRAFYFSIVVLLVAPFFFIFVF
jgi:hypothetical protein